MEPNLATNAAATRRKRVLLMIETSMSFGRGVLDGISRYLIERQDWSVQLDEHELVVAPPAWLETWPGDGIITRSNTPEMAAIIGRLGVPVVNLTDIYPDRGFPSVLNDHARIGAMAAEHLIERGFKNLAIAGSVITMVAPALPRILWPVEHTSG